MARSARPLAHSRLFGVVRPRGPPLFRVLERGPTSRVCPVARNKRGFPVRPAVGGSNRARRANATTASFRLKPTRVYPTNSRLNAHQRNGRWWLGSGGGFSAHSRLASLLASEVPASLFASSSLRGQIRSETPPLPSPNWRWINAGTHPLSFFVWHIGRAPPPPPVNLAERTAPSQPTAGDKALRFP